MYIITTISSKNPNEERYYAIDDKSGEPYWTPIFISGEPFDTLEKAEKILEGPDFNKENIMSGGTIYPPSMIHRGSHIQPGNEKGLMHVYIKRVYFIIEYQRSFTSEIKEPKGYIY